MQSLGPQCCIWKPGQRLIETHRGVDSVEVSVTYEVTLIQNAVKNLLKKSGELNGGD